MNIASLVVTVLPEHLDATAAALAVSGLCDVFFRDSRGVIIVTIENENESDGINRIKAIQALPHVLSVNIAYAYNDNAISE